MENRTNYYEFDNKLYTDYNYSVYSYEAGKDALFKSNVYMALQHLNIGVYINVTALVIGLIGNCLTIFVILFNKSMRTPTNYYLINFAVADLVLLMNLVAWEMMPAHSILFDLCYTFHLLTCTSLYASILTITAVTVERYIAICIPLISALSVSRVIESIFIIWLVAGISGYYQVTYLKPAGWYSCTFTIDDVFVLYNVYACIYFLLPLIIMVVLYTLIGITLMKSSRIQKQVRSVRNHRGTEPKVVDGSKSIKTLIAVVAVFFICWANYFIGSLFIIYTNYFLKLDLPYVVLCLKCRYVMSYIQNYAFLLSIVVNPVIYIIMSKKFRTAFKEFFCKICQIAQMRS